MIDLLLKGGIYPDFEEERMKKANIGIVDGRISYIGQNEPVAKKVINIEHRVVSPGFIDIHMHEDDLTEGRPEFDIGNLMLMMGVTTACGGNCGTQYQSLAEFKSSIERLGGSPVNWVMLAGYNTLRESLSLGHNEVMSDEQRKVIRDMLSSELAQGAAGISFGIEYDPAMTFEDMADALSLLSDSRYLAAAHFRQSGSGAIESLKEMNALSEATGVKFQISHLCSCSATGQMKDSLRLIDQMIANNPLLDFDTYPYNAFSTSIGSEVFSKESLKQWCRNIGDIMLTQDPYKNMFCTEELLKAARAAYPEMLAVGFIMNEDEITAALADKHGMIGSDGILFNGNGHPRAAGTFPRVLGNYVREKKALSLMEALKKMTVKPADRLSLNDRGRIAVGGWADLTIFNPDTIADGASYDNLRVPPLGIDYVLLAGKVAVEHQKIICDRLGTFLAFQRG